MNRVIGPGAARWMGLVAALVFVAAACGGNDGSRDAGDGNAAGTNGDAGGGSELPTDELELPDGTTTTFAALLEDGKPLVLNFFASWCAPCRAEMPDSHGTRCPGRLFPGWTTVAATRGME